MPPCAHTEHTLYRISPRPGVMRIADLCTRCLANVRGDGVYVPYGMFRGTQASLPLLDSSMVPHYPCVRCGTTTDVELHHWAPRALFSDADLWPMAYLCRICHTTWHTIIKLAGASHPNTSTRADVDIRDQVNVRAGADE